MGDLWHESVLTDDIGRVLNCAASCADCDELFAPTVRWFFLTKRVERMARWRMEDPAWWTGVSICTDQEARTKIPILQTVTTSHRWLSIEPLLEPIILPTLTGIDFVAVGSETGPGARPCKDEWIDSIIRQCKNQNVECFDKRKDRK